MLFLANHLARPERTKSNLAETTTKNIQ